MNTNVLLIGKKLVKLDRKYQQDDNGKDSEGERLQQICVLPYFLWYISGWKRPKSKIESVAKKIWKIWCEERERCPRAGITPVYIDPSGSIEVNSLLTCTCQYFIVLKILLTRYTKNDEIQLGLPKGKMEYGEYVIDCAVREVN